MNGTVTADHNGNRTQRSIHAPDPFEELAAQCSGGGARVGLAFRRAGQEPSGEWITLEVSLEIQTPQTAQHMHAGIQHMTAFGQQELANIYHYLKAHG